MPSRGLAAIVLDVDGTLYRPAPVRREMALALARYSLLHPAEGLRTVRAIRAYRRAQEELRAAGAGGSPARQIEIAARAAACPKDWMAGVVRRWMEEAPLAAVARARYPGVLEFCRWAAGRGIALAALSDYPAARKLEALGISQYIPEVACAQDPEIGCFKPDPAGLLRLLRRLNVEPAHAAYVGDRPEVDGALALAAGVQGFLLTRRGWGELRAAVEAAAGSYIL